MASVLSRPQCVNSLWPSDTIWWHIYLGQQCMILNIFKDCHSGYSNLKIYSPIKFCCGHIFQWYKKLRSFNSNMGYKISRSHSPEEFFIALAIRLLLKLNTGSTLALIMVCSLTTPSITCTSAESRLSASISIPFPRKCITYAGKKYH